MTGRFEPFAVSDLEDMVVQPRHAFLVQPILARPLYFQSVMVGPYSWTYWTAFGQPVACAGILRNGHAWAFLGADMRRHMVPFLRATRLALEAHPGPVLCEIDMDRPEAVRWAGILGFRPDAGKVWKFK